MTPNTPRRKLPNPFALIALVAAALALLLNLALGLRLDTPQTYLLPGLLLFSALTIAFIPYRPTGALRVSRRIVIIVVCLFIGMNLLAAVVATAVYLAKPDSATTSAPHTAAELSTGFSTIDNPTGQCATIADKALVTTPCANHDAVYAVVTTTTTAALCPDVDRVIQTGPNRYTCVDLNWTAGSCIATSPTSDHIAPCDRPQPGYLLEKPTKIVLDRTAEAQCGTDGGRINVRRNYIVCTQVIN
ncbi:hypothetical protein [Tsukamurella soli]|uniref:Uncharacterized protein n=1 Tax=Tsukamurella soli TaxID=644556 RepID=A0ABP8JQ78_9ACTN